MKENHYKENKESRDWLMGQTGHKVFVIWDTYSADNVIIEGEPRQGNLYTLEEICKYLEKAENQNLVINHSETICAITYYESGNDCDTILFVLAKEL